MGLIQLGDIIIQMDGAGKECPDACVGYVIKG